SISGGTFAPASSKARFGTGNRNHTTGPRGEFKTLAAPSLHSISTGVTSSPIRLIQQRITPPGFRNVPVDEPTLAGVPVEMRCPVSRLQMWKKKFASALQ